MTQKSFDRSQQPSALDTGLTSFQHNIIVVLMIPEFVSLGGPWSVLPPGIHDADLDEIELRFATTERRKELFQGFTRGIELLRRAGCSVVHLDGSFITAKETPGDFDACWDPAGVNINELVPVFLDFQNDRAAQKREFGGEFFVSSSRAAGTSTFTDFFQIDKDTGKQKGIVRVLLR